MTKLSLKKRFVSASAGTLSAICVFGIAFAAQPEIAPDESTRNTAYAYAQQVTDEDMAELEKLMDEDVLEEIRDTLVEDSNTSVIMSYVQRDEGFMEVLEGYFED